MHTVHARGMRRLLCRACIQMSVVGLQVLSTEEAPFKAPEPSPFRSDGGGELAPVAHKYRRIALGGDQTLVVRCEVRVHPMGIQDTQLPLLVPRSLRQPEHVVSLALQFQCITANRGRLAAEEDPA